MKTVMAKKNQTLKDEAGANKPEQSDQSEEPDAEESAQSMLEEQVLP